MKFLNQGQPQTLFIATVLLYASAIFGLIGILGLLGLYGLLTIAGFAVGGFGIANERKWGYAIAVGAAILQVVLLVTVFRGELLESLVIINLMFALGLLALLLHPESRDYQRIWFK
jgi:hypothetical protein